MTLNEALIIIESLKAENARLRKLLKQASEYVKTHYLSSRYGFGETARILLKEIVDAIGN